MGLRLAAIRAAEAPLLQGVIWNKQGAVAPKRTWGPIIFISKYLSSYNINNQLAKFEKNLSVGSISVE